MRCAIVVLFAGLVMSPLFFHFSGDRYKAATHVTEAKNRMFLFKQGMELGKLKQNYSQIFDLLDGSKMRLSSVFGMDKVEIWSPVIVREEVGVVLAQEMIFAIGRNTSSTMIQRIKPGDGTLMWEESIGVSTASPQSVSASGKYVVGITSDSTLNKMHVEVKRVGRGEQVWQKDFQDGPQEAGQVVRIDEMGLFVLSDVFNSGWSNRVRSLDLKDGETLWTYTPPANTWLYGLGINDTHVFVGAQTSTDTWTVYALRREDGSVEWTGTDTSFTYGYPEQVAVSGNKVFVTGQVYNGDEPSYVFWMTECRDAKTGEQVWSNSEIKSYYESPYSMSTDGASVLITGTDAEVVWNGYYWQSTQYPRVEARKGGDGSLSWTFRRDGIYYGSAVGNSLMYVCGTNWPYPDPAYAFIQGIEKSTGDKKWEVNSSGYSYIKDITTVYTKSKER